MDKKLTAMQEFIKWLSTRYHPSKYALVEKATELLELEREQIINARVTSPVLDELGKDAYVKEAEQYFEQTFSKQ